MEAWFTRNLAIKRIALMPNGFGHMRESNFAFRDGLRGQYFSKRNGFTSARSRRLLRKSGLRLLKPAAQITREFGYQLQFSG
jgi:hypothetical protein